MNKVNNTEIIKRNLTKKIPSRLSKMFFIKYEREKKNVEISFSYSISLSKERSFNLNRNINETIGKTFEKLSLNLSKQLTIQQKINVKKFKSEDNAVKIVDDEVLVELYDFDDQIISNETLNEEAWKEGYKIYYNFFFFFKDYNADVVFLQECDEDFFEGDLKTSFDEAYSGFIKIKGDSREGEAIYFRNDRFK